MVPRDGPAQRQPVRWSLMVAKLERQPVRRCAVLLATVYPQPQLVRWSLEAARPRVDDAAGRGTR